MKRAHIFLLLLALSGYQAAATTTAARAQETRAGTREATTAGTGALLSASETEKWREDLRYMAEEMPKYHKNLYHTMTREQFERAVAGLRERLPRLARHQIIVEMARIAALVGDGHTNIAPTRDPKINFRTLPVKFYLFKDGLFIRAADRAHAALTGARVVRIGGASADEAVARAREIIGRDNEMDVRFFAPMLLSMPEVLHALELSSQLDSAQFVVETEGRQQTITLKPVGAADLLPPDTDLSWMPKEGWVDLRDSATAPLPLWLKDPQNKFWFEYLPQARSLYVQINEVGNKDTETLADFSQRLFAFVEANQVEKLIFDLRLNRGGNGMLLRPLVTGIIKSKLNQPGKLFAIIGRSTWSASQFLLNDLEEFTNVLFVGEPSGSKGNIYGDSRKITLPHSGISVRVSVYYWQDWPPWDTRQWTPPDLSAELSSEDYRANRDPAMQAIVNYAPRQKLTAILDEALTEGGVEMAVKRFREFKAEPLNKYVATEEPLLIAGQRLLNEKKPELALALFKLNAVEHPRSFRTYHALGEAYFRIGDKEQAIGNFVKSLELNPRNYDVSQRLKQARQK
ncbi:MAG TPA: tetratricopeptide repeat protein [Pyrinomonadaceae bacterium]|nr:tetratricopeptide repeat protein [Pyrinomonadaceae bacterium]